MSKVIYIYCNLLLLVAALLFTTQNSYVLAQNPLQECNLANPQCPANTTCTPQPYTNQAYCRTNPTSEPTCDSSHPCTSPKVCTVVPFRGSVCIDPPPTYSTCDPDRPNCPSGKICRKEQFQITGYCVNPPTTIIPLPSTTTTSSAGKYCREGDPSSGISTAIGCIHTDPKEFIRDLLRFVTAIAGGIAFLMMLIGAFQMITSAGNPDSLQAGKERFTSAIVGLLFVIFSILLLKIVGIDILGLDKFLGY